MHASDIAIEDCENFFTTDSLLSGMVVALSTCGREPLDEGVASTETVSGSSAVECHVLCILTKTPGCHVRTLG